MLINIDGKNYEVIIIRKNNKNVYIRVKEDLKIYVTANRLTTDNKIKKIINENYNSIIKMIERANKKKETNEKTMILGKEVDVIKMSTQTEPELYENKFYVKSDNYEKNLKEYASIIFIERLNAMHSLFKEKIPYPKLKIRKMTSRWGVCNVKDKTVTLNFELIKRDIKYLDYVIVHELSHFIHPNHSKSFWFLVSKYIPNYKELRKEMRE